MGTGFVLFGIIERHTASSSWSGNITQVLRADVTFVSMPPCTLQERTQLLPAVKPFVMHTHFLLSGLGSFFFNSKVIVVFKLVDNGIYWLDSFCGYEKTLLLKMTNDKNIKILQNMLQR